MLRDNQSRRDWFELLANMACSNGRLILIADIAGRHLDLPIAASHNGCTGRIGKMRRSQPVRRVPLPLISNAITSVRLIREQLCLVSTRRTTPNILARRGTTDAKRNDIET